jgi:glycerophosphoryl diester phosphodiesterase
MILRRITATLAATCLLVSPAAASLSSAPSKGVSDVCTEVPEPSRWIDPESPDRGRRHPIIAVHRGDAQVAPENTLEAYRGALAYEMDMIEVDVQQTADHRYVAFHDLDAARR